MFEASWKALALWFAGLLLTLFGWLGQRHIKRIDDIAEHYASKNDIVTLHKRIDTLILEITHLRKEIENASSSGR